ncbi:hypothetical protein J437_LFUL003208 [Ladona fulva]|uniref:Protein kinase domain-containing protein n=1 Tax=Ladona fulva TaxID=123851 RepID=A0A8K0JXG1_LADFU|nr:hypothetical protein J437_LFUL003208 [Ladona fulva]
MSDGLGYLHKKGRIIHIEIELEKVLLSMDESYVRKLVVEVIELVVAVNCGMVETNRRKTAPITIANCWSSACIAFELAAGDLFLKFSKSRLFSG